MSNYCQIWFSLTFRWLILTFLTKQSCFFQNKYLPIYFYFYRTAKDVSFHFHRVLVAKREFAQRYAAQKNVFFRDFIELLLLSATRSPLPYDVIATLLHYVCFDIASTLPKDLKTLRFPTGLCTKKVEKRLFLRFSTSWKND